MKIKKDLAWGFWFEKMDQNIQDIGDIIRRMAMGGSYIQTETCMKANESMIKLMEKENIFILMERPMTETEKKTNKMDSAKNDEMMAHTIVATIKKD